MPASVSCLAYVFLSSGQTNSKCRPACLVAHFTVQHAPMQSEVCLRCGRNAMAIYQSLDDARHSLATLF